MPDPQSGSKQTLTIIVFALAFCVLIYIGMTYLAPVTPSQPPPPILYTILLAGALITTIAVPTLERYFLDRGKGPARVQMAVVAAGGLSETAALLGLVFYFISGRREWIFFVLSGIAFARLLLRLPEYYRLMEEE